MTYDKNNSSGSDFLAKELVPQIFVSKLINIRLDLLE